MVISFTTSKPNPDQHHQVMVFGSATSRTRDMRFGWRATICMAPAPHVDGDPFLGFGQIAPTGALCRAPRRALPEVSGHNDGRMRRPEVGAPSVVRRTAGRHHRRVTAAAIRHVAQPLVICARR